MSKFKLLKQLEYLIAFQADCLAKGEWEDFDRAENDIKKLEELIMSWNENNESEDTFQFQIDNLTDNLCRDYEVSQRIAS